MIDKHSYYAAATMLRSAAVLLQGLVHRDVTPTNVLMSQWFGDVYLSDFGLICPAGELRGFVAGYNLSYIPPEMITQDNSGIYVINSDPAKLSQVAQTSADIFQAGFTLYELYTACRPPGLESVPMGSSSSDPAVMSEYLSRVATYDWQAAINSNVRPSNPGLAALLDVMLLLNPQARHSPAQLLQQPYLAAKHAVAVEEVEQRQQNWTAERAAARKALKYLKADSAVTRLAEDGLMLPVMAARAAAATAALVATASSDADKPDAAGQQQQKQDSEPIDDSSNSSRSSIEAPDTPSAVASAATSQGCANSSSESSSSGSPGPQQQKTQVTEPQIVVMFIKVPCEALSAPCSSDHTAKAAAAAVRDVKDAAHQCNLHGDSSVMLSSTDEQMSSTKVSPPTSSGCSSSTTALATMVTAAAPHSSAVSTITAATTAACSIEQASNGEEVLCTTATMPESQLQRCEQQQHQQQDQDSSGGSPPRRRPLTNAVLKVGSLVKRILGRRKSQGTSMC